MLCDIARIRILLPLAAALVLSACQSAVSTNPATGAATSARPTASASSSPTPSATPHHVFVIVLENTSYDQALAQPFIAGLANRYTLATDYHDVGRPSLPNYLAMTSGSTYGIGDDGYHQLPPTGLGNQLTAAGVSWKGYFEGFTGNCFTSPYPYALKHDPFVYYGGQCPANIVPLTQLTTDLSGDTPMLSWITPGLCNDGHDCGVARADRWLSQVVPQITASQAWQQNGLLLITWDESNDGTNRVALLAIAPNLKGQIGARMDHYGLLATVEDVLDVARLGEAKQATSLIQQLH